MRVIRNRRFDAGSPRKRGAANGKNTFAARWVISPQTSASDTHPSPARKAQMNLQKKVESGLRMYGADDHASVRLAARIGQAQLAPFADVLLNETEEIYTKLITDGVSPP